MRLVKIFLRLLSKSIYIAKMHVAWYENFALHLKYLDWKISHLIFDTKYFKKIIGFVKHVINVLSKYSTFFWTNICWNHTTLGRSNEYSSIHISIYFMFSLFISMFTIVTCTTEFALHTSDLLDLILSNLSLSTLMPLSATE